MTLKETYLLGYAYGLLNGISMRTDVPDEVKNLCKEAVRVYEEHKANEERET